MNVDVDKLKTDFLSVMNDIYNEEVFFVESCHKFPSKYTPKMLSLDLSLRIFFEENNKIILGGKCLKYCDRDTRRKIKLADISDEVNSPDVNIINNYIIEDTWKQIDW